MAPRKSADRLGLEKRDQPETVRLVSKIVKSLHSRDQLSFRGIIACGNRVPVNDVEKSLYIVGTAILIVQIIRMLPDIQPENWSSDAIDEAGHSRIVLIGRRADAKLPTAINAKPSPTAAKASCCRL